MERHQVPENLVSSKISYIERIGEDLYYMTRNEILQSDLSGENFSVFRKSEKDAPFYGMSAPKLAISANGILDIKTGNLLAKKEEAASTICASNGKVYQYYYITGTVLELSAEGTDTIVKNLKRSKEPTPLITGVRNTSSGTWIMTYDGIYLVEEDKWLFPSMPVSDVIETQDAHIGFQP